MPLTPNDVCVRKLVSDFLIAPRVSQQVLLARELIPEVRAPLNSEFGKVPVGSAFRTSVDDDVNDQGVANILDFETEFVTFDPKIRALKAVIPQRVVEAAQEPFRPRAQSLGRVVNTLLLKYEKRTHDALNSGSFTAVAATAAFGAAGDNPIGDLTARIKAVADACGMPPNTVVFGNDAWRRWRETSEVIDRVKDAFGKTEMKDVTPGLAATGSFLNIEDAPDFRVYVARSRHNTAKKGQTATMVPIWTENRVWIGCFDRNLPQKQTATVNRPAGSPGDMGDFEGVMSPIITTFGPRHGEQREWIDPENGDMGIRANWDYDQPVTETSCLQI